MEKISFINYKSPFGELIIGSFEDRICICDWRYRKMRERIDKRISDFFKAEFREETNQIIDNCILQLEEYFAAKRKEFDLPILLAGTDFQIKVWYELMKIPFGETTTYLGLSRKLNNEKAIRAVASANGANPLSIIIPCHRVIGSNGEMIGYAGGKSVKKKLLQLEGVFPNGQMALDLF